MVMHTSPDLTSDGAIVKDRSPAAEMAEMRSLLALRTRERDALQDERDALRARVDTLIEECDTAIAQWRQRCETSLDKQIELAAAVNTRAGTDGHALPADAERIIAQKDAYILHLEGLLAASPISLLGSWWTFRRRRSVTS